MYRFCLDASKTVLREMQERSEQCPHGGRHRSTRDLGGVVRGACVVAACSKDSPSADEARRLRDLAAWTRSRASVAGKPSPPGAHRYGVVRSARGTRLAEPGRRTCRPRAGGICRMPRPAGIWHLGSVLGLLGTGDREDRMRGSSGSPSYVRAEPFRFFRTQGMALDNTHCTERRNTELPFHALRREENSLPPGLQ